MKLQCLTSMKSFNQPHEYKTKLSCQRVLFYTDTTDTQENSVITFS